MSDLINTLETPGEFDALSNLRPGEPYFLLVGRDRLAPEGVQDWADKNRARALAEFEAGTIDEEKRDRELRKSTQAEAIGWAMQSYKAGQMSEAIAKAPDHRPTYSGHELPEDTARRDRIHSARINAASAIHNALAELDDCLKLLAENGVPLGGTSIETVERMRHLAARLTPERPGISS